MTMRTRYARGAEGAGRAFRHARTAGDIAARRCDCARSPRRSPSAHFLLIGSAAKQFRSALVARHAQPCRSRQRNRHADPRATCRRISPRATCCCSLSGRCDVAADHRDGRIVRARACRHDAGEADRAFLAGREASQARRRRRRASDRSAGPAAARGIRQSGGVKPMQAARSTIDGSTCGIRLPHSPRDVMRVAVASWTSPVCRRHRVVPRRCDACTASRGCRRVVFSRGGCAGAARPN